MKIYEYDQNGYFTGDSRDVHPMQAIPTRWTVVELPQLPSGKVAKFGGQTWSIVDYIAPVPSSVTKRQAKQQLLITGLLSQVQPAIDSIVDQIEKQMIQIYWDDSQEYERNHPQLVALATQALGLTDEQLDDLFRAASTL